MERFTKSLYKYQIAAMLGIHVRTLARMINSKYYNDLKKLGYSKKQKLLYPHQLNYLQQKIDLCPDERI